MQQYLRQQRSQMGMPGMSDHRAIYGLTPEDVRKALAIDATIGNTTTPITGESLDPVVRSITLNSEAYAPGLRRWKTYQAKSYLEQFALQSSLGKSRFGGSAASEGDLGTSDSSVFERVTQNLRWFGQVGVVTRQAQRASAAKFGDLKKIEAYNRLVKLLLDIEYTLFHGNSTLNPYSFNGFFAQVDAISNNPNVIDLKTTGIAGSRTTYTGGGSLDLDVIRARMENALTHGGVHSSLWVAPADKISLSNDASVKERWNNISSGQSRIETGLTVDQVDNPLGKPADVVWSVWLKNGGRISEVCALDPVSTTAFHADAPNRMAAPTVAAAADGYLPADTYYYGVAALSRQAEGKIGIQTTGVTTTSSNGKVNVTVTHGSDVANVIAYALYRSDILPTSGDDYTKMRFVKEYAVAASPVPGGTQVLVDDGSVIPGSRYASLIDESVVSVPELLEPSIRDLSDIDNTHRFSIDAECCLLLHDSAKRHVVFKNIGGSVTNPV